MNSTLCSNAPQKSTVQSRTRYVRPAASLRVNSEAYILQLDLPGVNRDGLEVNVENQELTVIGRRTPREANTENQESLFCDVVYADYRRSFDLDPQIDSSKIEARLENGVLTLRLPKSEAVRPRRIEVAG